MPGQVDKLARRLADAIKKKNDGKKTEEEKSYNTGWKIFIGWVKAKDECGDECKRAKAKNVGGWLNVGSEAHKCVKAKFRKHKLVNEILLEHVRYHRAGGLLHAVGETLASVATGGISDIVLFFKNLPKMGKNLKKFGKDAEKSFKELFRSFKALMGIKSAKEAGPLAGKFAKQVIKTIYDINDKGGKLIGIPAMLRAAGGAIIGAATSGIATSALVPLAMINLGMRKLMAILLPKLILGVGKGIQELEKKFGILAPVIKGLMEVVKVAAGAGGSIVGSLFKDPKAKEQFKAILAKIANVSGKIKKGIDSALSIAEAARSGNLDSLEKAAGASGKLPSELTPQDLTKVVDGLLTFAGDQIWRLVDGAVRKLLGKLMSLLDQAIDVPRTALVGAVGEVPFVGGVLAGLLNLGFGIAVDMMKTFLVDEIIMKAVKGIVDDLLGDMKKEITRALKKEKGAAKAVSKIAGMMQFFGDIAGDLSQAAKSAAQGAKGSVSAIGAQVGSALLSLSLRGIHNAHLRKLISDAVGAIASKIGSRGASLVHLLKEAFIKCAAPIAKLVATPIKNPQTKDVVSRETARVIRDVASNPGSLRAAMKNPTGFMSDIAHKIVEVLKAELPRAGAPAELALRVADEVKDLGFAGLLRAKTWEPIAAAAQ
jgi:hypothetical protein